MSSYTTFGLSISTHGGADKVLVVKDAIMVVNDFVDPIKENPHLVGKPKVR